MRGFLSTDVVGSPLEKDCRVSVLLHCCGVPWWVSEFLFWSFQHLMFSLICWTTSRSHIFSNSLLSNYPPFLSLSLSLSLSCFHSFSLYSTLFSPSLIFCVLLHPFSSNLNSHSPIPISLCISFSFPSSLSPSPSYIRITLSFSHFRFLHPSLIPSLPPSCSLIPTVLPLNFLHLSLYLSLHLSLSFPLSFAPPWSDF